MLYRVQGGTRSAAGGPSAGLLLTEPLRGLVGFGVDPATLWLIADRLARPAGRQVLFRPPLPLRPLYPRPAQDPR